MPFGASESSLASSSAMAVANNGPMLPWESAGSRMRFCNRLVDSLSFHSLYELLSKGPCHVTGTGRSDRLGSKKQEGGNQAPFSIEIMTLSDRKR
jgi:hypothetical protein